mmetsp:Transcript_30061/g.48946  ORF Transcript_30061/g.48946 Transcript_30061/m.48946 type:complete len:287 (-) Transcript_30061:458-1318(-)
MEKEEAGSDRGDRSRNSSLSAVQKEVNSGWQIAKVSEFESHGAQESNHPEGEKEGYYSGSTSSDDDGSQGELTSAYDSDEQDDKDSDLENNAPKIKKREAQKRRCFKKLGEMTLLIGTEEKPVCILGPDWNLLVVTYILILSITLGLYYLILRPEKKLFESLVGLLLLLMVVFSLAKVAFSNPGIVKWHPSPRGERWTFCDRCRSFRPPRAIHCNACRVCIEGYDHHCPWTSKCVGKQNLRAFQIFLVSILLLVVFNITIAIEGFVAHSELMQRSSTNLYSFRSLH